jgi:photosystem II stability/assembly factor-like uncharacterized protein
MKKIILILLVALLPPISKNCYSQSNWVLLNTSTNYNLLSVFFINSETGFTGGVTGNLLKTTNGGINWAIKYTASSTIADIFFINNNTGWVIGYGGVKLKSTNCGETWFSISNSNHSKYSIQFKDSLLGFDVGGWNGAIYEKTTDGGMSWNQMLFSQYNNFNNIFFINYNTGFIAGCRNLNYISNSPLLKTTDGGTTWINKLPRMPEYQNVQFTSNDTGYVIWYYQYLMKTINCGENWDSIYKFILNPINDSYFINNNTGFVISSDGSGHGVVYKTINGGFNWSTSIFNTQIPLNAIRFINPNTGYIACENGYIYKTTNGGVGIKQISEIVPRSYSLSQNYPNPFNPVTKIRFDLPNRFPIKTFGNDRVVLKVYDILGKEIETLVNEQLAPGTYSVDFDSTNFPSGVYFYRIVAGDFISVKRMVLIK